MQPIMNNNIAALRAVHLMNQNTRFSETTYEQLSTGRRIVRASDGPVEYAISQKIKQDRLSVAQAGTNVANGVSILQTTESGLQTIQDHLHRIRELTVQTANDVIGLDSRKSIAKEIRSLTDEINRIASSAEFNGMKLLNGTATNQYVQLGPRSSLAGNTIDISSALASAAADLTGGGLGIIDTGATLTFDSLNDIYDASTDTTQLDDNTTARAFLNDIDNAIKRVLTRRGTIGAIQNRLTAAADNLATYEQNLTQSESSIRDVEVGKAAMQLSTAQLKLQTATDVLARLNQFQNSSIQRLLAAG